MDRQRCVINAIIKQANPANMLARYEDIAKAGKDIVKTDMPREVLPLMVDLCLRVKDGNVRSVVFKHGVDGFFSPDPDFASDAPAGQGGRQGDQEGSLLTVAVLDQEGQVGLAEVQWLLRRRQSQRGHRRLLRLPALGRGHRPAGTLRPDRGRFPQSIR